jgi:hypothetical protein
LWVLKAAQRALKLVANRNMILRRRRKWMSR